jgi:hypothetical protein
MRGGTIIGDQTPCETGTKRVATHRPTFGQRPVSICSPNPAQQDGFE